MDSSGEPGTDGRGDPAREPRRYGRRVFLVTVAGGLGSLFWGRTVWSRVAGAVAPVADTIAPFLPSGGWRIYTVSWHMPVFDPSSWRLEVGGLVEAPLSLGWDEWRALPRAEQVSTFHCVTGWTVANVRWGGVRLDDLLARARPRSGAGALSFVSAEDPYADSLTLKQASMHDVLLADEMDGKPLRREHGAPLRLVVPEMYGYKSVKWVQRVDLVAHAEDGYWEQLGYDRDAWVGRSNGYSS